jgi:PASTA domain
MGTSNPAAATGLGIPSTTTAIGRPSLVVPLVYGSRGRVGGLGDRGPERRQRPHQYGHPGDIAADDRLLAADRGHDLSTTSTIPPTTVAVVKVPKLVGMRLTSAKAALADRGLRGTVRYQTTNRYQAGTVMSQSRRTGAGVLPDSTITLGLPRFDGQGWWLGQATCSMASWLVVVSNSSGVM